MLLNQTALAAGASPPVSGASTVKAQQPEPSGFGGLLAELVTATPEATSLPQPEAQAPIGTSDKPAAAGGSQAASSTAAKPVAAFPAPPQVAAAPAPVTRPPPAVAATTSAERAQECQAAPHAATKPVVLSPPQDPPEQPQPPSVARPRQPTAAREPADHKAGDQASAVPATPPSDAVVMTPPPSVAAPPPAHAPQEAPQPADRHSDDASSSAVTAAVPADGAPGAVAPSHQPPPPAAPEPARAEAPVPRAAALEAADRVVARVSRAVQDGTRVLTMELHPAELGRVEVRLSFHDSGVGVQMTLDRPETFDAFTRARTSMEQHLADAGINLAGGGLDLRFGQQQPDRPTLPSPTALRLPLVTDAATQDSRPRQRDGLVDILA